MEKQKIIRGNTDAEVWSQVQEDMNHISYPFMYSADIQHNEKSVFLNIEIDLGGGFDSGFQTTSLTAPVPIQFTTLSSRINEHKNFRFALHDEDFIDKVGKFFGMEDVQTGFAEFDKNLVVKTNDVERIREAFADEQTRKVFENLPGFNMHIASYGHEDSHCSLELTINRDITNVEELKKVYDAFVNVLDAFEFNNHPI
ncbi:MAG: hypothetical protein ABIN36_14650 [Ferruginibacter sp.]